MNMDSSVVAITEENVVFGDGPAKTLDGEQVFGMRESTWEKIQRRILQLSAQMSIARHGLNLIASWGEGKEVNSSFDSPENAKIARETLALIEKEGSNG